MRSHTRVGCLDHSKRLFQVVSGPGLKWAPALQAVDEVELCGTNAVSTVSDAGIAPDSLVSGPDLAQSVDTNRSCVSLERSLVKGRPGVVVFHKAVTLNRPHRPIGVPQRQDHVVFAGDVRVSSRALGIDRNNVSEQEARGVDVVHQDLVDHEALQLTKIGLLRIWLIAPAMAHPGSESVSERGSDIPEGNECLGS